MTETERKQIIALVQREVVPAIGCTEPIAVALCVAKATETLGAKPEKIDVLLRDSRYGHDRVAYRRSFGSVNR